MGYANQFLLFLKMLISKVVSGALSRILLALCCFWLVSERYLHNKYLFKSLFKCTCLFILRGSIMLCIVSVTRIFCLVLFLLFHVVNKHIISMFVLLQLLLLK